MNEELLLRTLASRARWDAPPEVDVSADVLARIQARPGRRRANVLLWVYTGAAIAAASFVAALTLQTLLERQAAAMDIVGPVMGTLP